MKSKSIFLTALIAVIAYSRADEVSNSKLMKINIAEAWKDTGIKMVAPDWDGQRTNGSDDFRVKRAVYEIIPKPNPATESGMFSVLDIHNPYTQKRIFIEGDDSFYVTEISGMKGFSVGPGVLVWSGSYLELPDSKDDTAIRQFETTFDSQKRKQSDQKRVTENRIVLRQAVTQFYFSQSPYAGGGILAPQVEAVSLTNGVLRLDLRNPATKIPATLWIDLKVKKVVKSVVNGDEMDLNSLGVNAPYAVPIRRKL